MVFLYDLPRRTVHIVYLIEIQKSLPWTRALGGFCFKFECVHSNLHTITQILVLDNYSVSCEPFIDICRDCRIDHQRESLVSSKIVTSDSLFDNYKENTQYRKTCVNKHALYFWPSHFAGRDYICIHVRCSHY